MTTTRPDEPRILVLGPIDVVGGSTPLGGAQRRLLLAALALRAGRVVAADHLAGLLWPASPPVDPQRSLQVQVSKLRRAVEDPGLGGIEFRAGGYVLEVDAGTVDAVLFERLVAEGLGADPARARDLFVRALSLWRGRPLGGLADDTDLRPALARLEDLRLRALQARIAADLTAGHAEAVVDELLRLTEQHPLEERFWADLVLAQYRVGRTAEALAAYDRARSTLAEELGTDPSRELQQLHRQVLRQDPALDEPTPPTVASQPPGRTVAVLPFDVVGAGRDIELLASGLHTDLLTELSRSRELTVISRTSVLRYRGADVAVEQIARELDVGTVVTGSLQAAGSRFRLTVQLVDGARGDQRWAESYDDDVSTESIFTVQTDLARDIAASVSAELAPEGGERGHAPTADLEAYRLVAAGREQIDRKTAEGHRRAVAAYEQAIRRDPDYVQGWAGLAEALVSTELYGYVAEDVTLLPRAEEAVRRALALDPDAPAARTSLGVLATAHQDGPSALRALDRVRQLRPGDADAHNWHSWVSLLTGDARSGLEGARRAARLNPRSAEAHAHVALALAATGDPRRGLEAARRARGLSPYATAVLYEGLCLYELERFGAARDVLEPLVHGLDEPPVPWAEGGLQALLVATLVELGSIDDARRVAATLDASQTPFSAGLAGLALGDEVAVELLGGLHRLTAWPCLVVHHFLGRLWHRPASAGVRDHLVEAALRSWAVPPGER